MAVNIKSKTTPRNYLKGYFLFVLLLFGLFVSSQSTRLQFNHITQLNGLSQSEVYSITQDNKGYIWVATMGGLNRYNGYTFEVYKNNTLDSTSISSNNIRGLHQDGNGNLWIGTRGGGLNLYNYKTNNFISFKQSDTIENSLANNSLVNIQESKNGLLFFCTSKGISCISTKDPEYASKPSFTKLNDFSVYQMAEIDNNIFWLATAKGIFKVRIENSKMEILNNLTKDNNQLPTDNFYSIYAESNSIIWAASNAGLLKVIDNNGTFSITTYQKQDGLGDNFVNCVYEDKSKNLWIGTRGGGLSLLNRTTNKITTYAKSIYFDKSLGGNMIGCLYQDQTGILWVGTYGNGLSNVDLMHNKFDNYKIILNSQTELPSNFIRAIYPDTDGTIWLGTLYGGFFKYDRKNDNFINLDFKNSLNEIVKNGYSVFDIQKFDDNNLIVATNDGLCIYNKTSGQYTYFRYNDNNPKKILGNSVFTINKDDNGVFWVGTWNGLHKFSYNNNQGSFEYFLHQESNPKSISNDNIVYIYNDPLNTDMWIGTMSGGLSRMVTNPITGEVVFHNYVNDQNNPNSLSDNKVNMILRSKKGDIWVATENGLNKLVLGNGQNFIRYTEINGLPNNSVKSILEDDYGNIWLGTNDRLSMFNPETNEFSNYSFEDGLQSNEFSEHTCVKGLNGEVFFGGVKGFNSFYPSKLKTNIFKPQIVLTNFYISNKRVRMGVSINGRVLLNAPIDQTEEITLSYKENYISFEFAALHFSSPSKNKYAYMLEGFNSDWIYTDAKQRIASFTNLKGGEYTLRIKASNNDGVWSEPIELKLRVKPPFWETWAFRIFIFLFLAGIVYLIYRNRVTSMKEQQINLQQKIGENNRELEASKAVVDQSKLELEDQKVELKRRDEQEHDMRYMNAGLARFSELINKEKNDIRRLCQHVISELVNYTEAIQGVIFLITDNDEHPQLEIMGSYALDLERLNQQFFELGEGNVGACYFENKIIFLDSLPDSYIRVSSSLGGTIPRSVVFVPISQDKTVVGVIEISSLTKLQEYKISFIKKLGETFGANVLLLGMMAKNERIIEQTKQQAEELRAQEEEMRQNIEELQATQEEMTRLNEQDKLKEDKLALEMEKQYEKLKKYQLELLQVEALFNSFLINATEFVYFKDLESKFLRCSNSLVNYFGLNSEAEIIGKSDFDFFDEEHAQKTFESEQKIIKEKKPLLNVTEKEVVLDGAISYKYTSKMPLYNANNEVIGTWGITKSINRGVLED